MANSRFEYVRTFERENILLPQTHIIIRIDGRGFHKFSSAYEFQKPNDPNALKVMNLSAQALMKSIPDVMMAYGDSDEYSFLLRKNCDLLREEKRLPTFDARAVVYPSDSIVKDYFRWRQVDCHINNLYNTSFWNLVIKGHLSPQEAENKLMGTVSSDKNELLFKEFGINYNDEPEMYKKGTVFIRDVRDTLDLVPNSDVNLSKRQVERLRGKLRKVTINELHCDIIKEEFWNKRAWLLK
ncbi:hypothetical protein HII13_000880 [Brettanomyces bruxellensis]|nr:hypothetical protein HII13_000880 [Brettanomyces bruxellensis]